MRTVNILYGSCFAEYSVSYYLQACPGMTFYDSVLHVQFSAGNVLINVPSLP